MSTKIQINSLAALERLIGNDEELEIEVRKSVIEAFAKSFVKSVYNVDKIHEQVDKMKADRVAQIEEMTLKELGIQKQRSWHNDYHYNLTSDAKTEILKEIKAQHQSYITGVVQSVLLADGLMSQIKKIAEELINTAVKDEVAKILSNELYDKIRKELTGDMKNV